jgi:hypothetical protein
LFNRRARKRRVQRHLILGAVGCAHETRVAGNGRLVRPAFTWRKSSAHEPKSNGTYGSGPWRHRSLFSIRTSACTKRFSTASCELANGSTCTVGLGRLCAASARDADRATLSIRSSAYPPSRCRPVAELGACACRPRRQTTASSLIPSVRQGARAPDASAVPDRRSSFSVHVNHRKTPSTGRNSRLGNVCRTRDDEVNPIS